MATTIKVTAQNQGMPSRSELDEIFDISFYNYAFKPPVLQEYEREIFDMVKVLGAIYMRLQQLVPIFTKLTELASNIQLPWDTRFRQYAGILTSTFNEYCNLTLQVYYETQSTKAILKKNINAITRLEVHKNNLTKRLGPVSSDSIVLLNRIFEDADYKTLAFQVNAGWIDLEYQHDRRISRYDKVYAQLVDMHRVLREYVDVYRKDSHDLREAGQNSVIIDTIRMYLPLIDRVRDEIHRLINYIKTEGYSNLLKAQNQYRKTHNIDPTFRKLDISGVSLREYAILRNNLLKALDRNISALVDERESKSMQRDILKGRDFNQMTIAVGEAVRPGTSGVAIAGVNSAGDYLYKGNQGATVGMHALADPAISSIAVNAIAADDILNANRLRLKYEHDNVSACLGRIDSDLKGCVRSLSAIQARDGARTQAYIDVVKVQKVLEAERQSKRELLKMLHDELAEINREQYNLEKRKYVAEIADDIRVKRDQIRDIQSQLREMTEVLIDGDMEVKLTESDLESDGLLNTARDAAEMLRRSVPMDRALTGIQPGSLLSMFGGARSKGSRRHQSGGGKNGHITITIRDEPDDVSPFKRVTPFMVPFLNAAYSREDLLLKLDAEMEDAMLAYSSEIEKQDLTDDVAHQLRETRRVELAKKRLTILKLFENLPMDLPIPKDVWDGLGLDDRKAWPGARKPILKLDNLTVPLEAFDLHRPTEKDIMFSEFQLMHTREYWRSKAAEHVRTTTLRALNLIIGQTKQIIGYIGKFDKYVSDPNPFPGTDKAEWDKYPVNGIDAKVMISCLDRIAAEFIKDDYLGRFYIPSQPCEYWEIKKNSTDPIEEPDLRTNIPRGINRHDELVGLVWKRLQSYNKGYGDILANTWNAMKRITLMVVASKNQEYVDKAVDTVAKYFSSFSAKAELIMRHEPKALNALSSCVIRVGALPLADFKIKHDKDSPNINRSQYNLVFDENRLMDPRHKGVVEALRSLRQAGIHRMQRKWEKHRFYYKIICEASDLSLEYLAYACSLLNRLPTDKAIAVICQAQQNKALFKFFKSIIPDYNGSDKGFGKAIQEQNIPEHTRRTKTPSGGPSGAPST